MRNADDENPAGEFDFHNFVVKSAYHISKYWSAGVKVKVEHTFDTDYGGGDVYIHNLYLKRKISKNLVVQTGIISMPITGGKGSYYGSVELSPVEKYLAYDWREAGVSISGNLNSNIQYKATLSTGLDPQELNSKSVIYSARNHRFSASLNNFAGGLQLIYKPVENFKLGTSLLYSGLNNSGETSTTFNGADYKFIELFGAYSYGNTAVRTVATYSAVSGSDIINEEFHSKVGSAQAGALFEISYDVSRLLSMRDQQLYTVVRTEYYDSHYRTSGTEDVSKYEHYDYTFGIVYQPTEMLEFKADFQIQRFGADYSSQVFDLGLGFHF